MKRLFLLIMITLFFLDSSLAANDINQGKYWNTWEDHFNLIYDGNYRGLVQYVNRIGPSLDLTTENTRKETPLILAVNILRTEITEGGNSYLRAYNTYLITRFLLSIVNQNIMKPDSQFDRDPVMWATLTDKPNEWLLRFIEDATLAKNYDFNRINSKGEHLVQIAAEMRNVVGLQKLIHVAYSRGKKIYLDGRSNDSEKTALMIAAKKDHFEMISYLLKMGANKYEPLNTPEYNTLPIPPYNLASDPMIKQYISRFPEQQYYSPKSYDFIKIPDEPINEIDNIHSNKTE
jgi:hypothetical protein